MKLSELNEDQKGHLAWRLDHKTGTGYITACCIARGQHGDLELVEIFKRAGMPEHAAKIHAHKVINYTIENWLKLRLQVGDKCPMCAPEHCGVWKDGQLVVCPVCGDRGTIDRKAIEILRARATN